MPIYWFHLDLSLPANVVRERLQLLVHEEPGWRLWLSSRRPSISPFIGWVRDDSFKLRRAIGYHNDFLPRLRGRIVPIPAGARVSVTMFVHPSVALFMTFWLGVLGYAALTHSAHRLGLCGMFAFGVVLISGGFFSEAFIARRILTDGLLGRVVPPSTGPMS